MKSIISNANETQRDKYQLTIETVEKLAFCHF